MPRRKPTLRNRNHRSPKIPSHSQSSEQPSEEDLPEQLIELTVTAVANGGACVARYDGRVVFVRHTLPGERVLARVTGSGSRGRFWFADAVEIIDPAPQRVDAPCQLAGPGGCGGCDYQHVALDEQRRWKSEVVAEQLQRLGGIAVDVPIRALPGSSDGLGWRSRIRYAVNESGQVGFHQYRSDQVVPVDRCLIASPEIQQAIGQVSIFQNGGLGVSETAEVGTQTDHAVDHAAVEALVHMGTQTEEVALASVSVKRQRTEELSPVDVISLPAGADFRAIVEEQRNRILEEQRSRILEELNRRPNRARMEAWTQRMSGVSVEDAMRIVENLNETHEGFTKNALIRHLVEKCRA